MLIKGSGAAAAAAVALVSAVLVFPRIQDGSQAACRYLLFVSSLDCARPIEWKICAFPLRRTEIHPSKTVCSWRSRPACTYLFIGASFTPSVCVRVCVLSVYSELLQSRRKQSYTPSPSSEWQKIKIQN